MFFIFLENVFEGKGGSGGGWSAGAAAPPRRNPKLNFFNFFLTIPFYSFFLLYSYYQKFPKLNQQS